MVSHKRKWARTGRRASMNREELVEIIERSAHDNATELDLPLEDIRSLPVEIGQITSLRNLHLDGNRLRSLPAEIGRLTALRNLDLYSNRLKTLPAEIGDVIHGGSR
ncbi:MAG: leucine-rich repeat domain-containing protein [Candidatus Omnitrophica bacterium]|nr:leucine-rich repeat domain-containing protein [Candidatus Omnitrophota bacterium]